VTLSTTVRSSDKPGMTQQVGDFPLLPPPYGAWPPNTCFCRVCPPALSSITCPSRIRRAAREIILHLAYIVIALSSSPLFAAMLRQFNFYQLPKRLMLVDLPGYGFAFANEHKMEGWKVLMDSYNKERKVLKRAFVILDARHGIKQNDRDFLNRLEFNKTVIKACLCLPTP